MGQLKDKRMRELAIFKNNTPLKNDNGVLMLHQDDMSMYNSWFLTEYHGVDKVIFRGESTKLSNGIIEEYKIPKDIYEASLSKIGNPKNVIITYSTQDTY